MQERSSTSGRWSDTATFIVNERRVLYRASIIYRQAEQNRDEPFQISEKWRFLDFKWREGWIKFPNYIVTTLDAKKSIAYSFANNTAFHVSRNITSQRGLTPDVMLVPPTIFSTLQAIFEFRASINYYAASQFTNPALSPTSFEIDDDKKLRESATDYGELTRFIYQLYYASITQKEKYAIHTLVSRSGVGLIDSIEWQETKFPSFALKLEAAEKS